LACTPINRTLRISSIFDSVVIVTDRTVLDRQIRKNIKDFAQVKNVVEAITGNATDIKKLDPTETSMSKTAHMRLALENNKKIITCTVQTFPFVLKAVNEMQSKNIAFIIVRHTAVKAVQQLQV